MKKNTMRLPAVLVLVILGAMSFAQNPNTTNREYLTFGRNPMVPGGVTFEQAIQRGWEPGNLPQDLWTTMYGARGERVTGWIKAGTPVAWDRDNRLRILECGNLTDLLRMKVPVLGEVRKEVVEKIVEVEVPGPVRYKTEYQTVYKDRNVYVPIRIFGMDNQHLAPLGAPTVINSGGSSFSYHGGLRLNNSNMQMQAQIAEAAAAAAAAASSSSSSTSTTPTSGAGTSGGSSSGSSGASDGGSNSGSSG